MPWISKRTMEPQTTDQGYMPLEDQTFGVSAGHSSRVDAGTMLRWSWRSLILEHTKWSYLFIKKNIPSRHYSSDLYPYLSFEHNNPKRIRRHASTYISKNFLLGLSRKIGLSWSQRFYHWRLGSQVNLLRYRWHYQNYLWVWREPTNLDAMVQKLCQYCQIKIRKSILKNIPYLFDK